MVGQHQTAWSNIGNRIGPLLSVCGLDSHGILDNDMHPPAISSVSVTNTTYKTHTHTQYLVPMILPQSLHNSLLPSFY